MEARCSIARRYSGHPFGKCRTAAELWELGGPIYVFLPSGAVYEVVAICKSPLDSQVTLLFICTHMPILFALPVDKEVSWFSLTFEDLVRAWKADFLLNRIIGRNLDAIEERLWRPRTGLMCIRYWNEINRLAPTPT